VKGRVLTAKELNAHNTFEKPDAIKPADFSGSKLSGSTLTVKLPPASVVMLELN
jgi:alpha-N-arabinofuranosidase